MTGSLTTVIRRTGLLLILVLGALAVVGSAQGGTGQGVPPQSTIDAASANWAAKAKLLDANGRPQFDQLPPLSSIDAASANWAAKAKLLDANGRPVSGVTVSPASGSTRFNWGDFGMGVAAMFGLVLLAIGLLAGTHYRRKGSVRPRPVS
jgi:hypothetical protein